MTIAACYLSPEGVVLGADSTTTYTGMDGSQQHLDHAQKLFEVGESGTLGIVCWGLGMPMYRTWIAELGDDIRANPPQSVQEVAEQWRDRFWNNYESMFAHELSAARGLAGIPQRTTDQEAVLRQLIGKFSGGFCLAGRIGPGRTIQAFQIVYAPHLDRSNSIAEITTPWMFWGCPNIVQRLAFGMDGEILEAILQSGRWAGTRQDIENIRSSQHLEPMSMLPLREAVDWVYSMIYSTVKMFKFSQLRPLCGGPIEIAAITTDRAFRWVKHKSLGEALTRDNIRTFPEIH